MKRLARFWGRLCNAWAHFTAPSECRHPFYPVPPTIEGIWGGDTAILMCGSCEHTYRVRISNRGIRQITKSLEHASRDSVHTRGDSSRHFPTRSLRV